MPETNSPDATSDAIIGTERVLAFPPAQVFAAFQQPEQLAQWWGPNGFSNTFEQFEFAPGGRWVFVMHGPNGAAYPNESVFQQIVPDEKIVIHHSSAPRFTLTVTLTPHGNGTHIAWSQEFESAEMAAKIRQALPTANEENLDRLEAVLANEPS